MKNLLVIISTLLYLNYSNAQDLHFSNLQLNNFYTSIASAGSTSAKFRGGLHYRNQHPTVGSAYQTMGLFTDYSVKLDDNALGIGLIMNRDNAGSVGLTKLRAEVMVAYHQKITRFSRLSGGIQFAVTQHSIDDSKTEWKNQYNGKKFDPNLPSREQPLFQPFMNYGAGAGLGWNYDAREYNRFSMVFTTVNLGASVYHIAASPLDYFNNEPEYNRIAFTGNSTFVLVHEVFEIEPAFSYQIKGKEQELILGALYKIILREESKYTGYYDKFDISVGGYYRFPNDAIIPTFNMNYDNFQFGVSYDANISDLSQATSTIGAFEFTLRFLVR